MIFNRSYIFNFVSMFEKYNSTTILKYVNKYKHFLESIFRIDFENNRDFMVFYVLVILAMMFWNCSISWSRSYHVIVYCWGKIKLQKERPITFVHPRRVTASRAVTSGGLWTLKGLRSCITVYLFREWNGLAQLLKSLWTMVFIQL